MACVIELHIGFSSGGCLVCQHITLDNPIKSLEWWCFVWSTLHRKVCKLITDVLLPFKIHFSFGSLHYCCLSALLTVNSYLTGVKFSLNMVSPPSQIIWQIQKQTLGLSPTFQDAVSQESYRVIWVRSRNCGCLVTWFCYQLIAKPGNKTATVSWPYPYNGALQPS